MSKKEVEFSNRDRFIELGLMIASLRKMQGLSQEKLAEKAKISRETGPRRPDSCLLSAACSTWRTVWPKPSYSRSRACSKLTLS